MNIVDRAEEAYRNLTIKAPFAVALFLLPPVFVWVLLRKRHSVATWLVGIVWLTIWSALLIGQAFSRTPSPPIASAAHEMAAPLAPTSTAPAAVSTPQPLEVELSLKAMGEGSTVIVGTTNLPDDTQLTVQLKRPHLRNEAQRLAMGLAACDPNCYPWESDVTVKDGEFLAGPFGEDATRADGSRGLNPGMYEIGVYMPMGQPKAVLSVVGQDGEYMKGPAIINLGNKEVPIFVVSYETKIYIPELLALEDIKLVNTAHWVPKGLPDGLVKVLGTLGEAEDICRGSVSSNAKAMAVACNWRDRLSGLLEHNGWCYGEAATSAADAKWDKCLAGPAAASTP